MKNLFVIACLLVATAMFGCAVGADSTVEPDVQSVRVDNATITDKGDVSVISNAGVSVTTSSLTLTEDLVEGGGVCCTNCNIYTGNCQECHTCAAE
jgi:hypothetical protein